MENTVTAELGRARQSYERRAWSQAFAGFMAAESVAELGAEDLEKLAAAAYLIGREDDYFAALERAYESYKRRDEPLRAARSAFWIGLGLLFRGEPARASGWLVRAERAIERCDTCVERGYLLLPEIEGKLGTGEWQQAWTMSTAAAELAERFDDADLLACARHLQGRALIGQGELSRGLTLLDEAMLVVITGHLSPVLTGLLYCSVIDVCQQMGIVARAREWTNALARWCEQQPDMLAFSGTCYVHRAEILQLQGAWEQAIAEAERACERCLRIRNRLAAAAAFYRRAEVHRLRGEFADAEEMYRAASQWGWDPQPGFALLRLAQGRLDVAAAASRRVIEVPAAPQERARMLAAHVEIMLAAGDVEEACRSCEELESISKQVGTEMLAATAAQARGAVELATGHALNAM
ncbi:MAG TPA: hypothetical protein VIL32_00190, partial [Steroidobacteraceae bacterium]